MFPEDSSPPQPTLLPINELDYGASDASAAAAQSLAGCDVTEYDALTGEKEWQDSVFVQAFTDSVLGTTPMPLDFEIE